MTRISQIISVVGGVKNDITGQMSQLERDISQDGLLDGLSRIHRARNDDGVSLPSQSTHVQKTVDETLNKARALMTRLLDLTRTLDEANARAAADVVVDGQIVLPMVTCTHLLSLEHDLANLHGFIAKMPVLNQAVTWSEEGTAPGIHKTEPVETSSTTKVPFNHELVKAQVIDGHLVEPKVQVMSRDEITGFWTTVKFSGAMDPRRKREILDRIQQLRVAVKFAREEANAGDAPDVREGKRIFDWLFR